MISSLTDLIFVVVYLLWAVFLIFSAGWCDDKAEKFRSMKSKETRRKGYFYLTMFILLEMIFSWFLLALGNIFLN